MLIAFPHGGIPINLERSGFAGDISIFIVATAQPVFKIPVS